MKGAALAFVALIVGILAGPSPHVGYDGPDVVGRILERYEELKQRIQDRGLDPYEFSGAVDFEGRFVSLSAFVDDLNFSGLSNIVVDNLDFDVLNNRVTFGFSLPSLSLTVGDAGFSVSIADRKEFEGSASGSFAINGVSLSGYVDIEIADDSSFSIVDLSLQFSLGGIESNLNLNLFGRDVSERVNSFLGDRIPAAIERRQDAINWLLQRLAWRLIQMRM